MPSDQLVDTIFWSVILFGGVAAILLYVWGAARG